MSLRTSLQRVPPYRARPINSIFCLVLLWCCVSTSTESAVAQEPTATDDEVLRVTTDLLLFPVRVRDKKGNRPNGLMENDLSLKDPDGVVSSVYFSPGVDRVAIVFALDQSGS